MNYIFMIGFLLAFTQRTVAQSGLANKKNLIGKEFEPILIAVIDTGSDIYHKDLKDHIWTNPGESGLDVFGNNKENNNNTIANNSNNKSVLNKSKEIEKRQKEIAPHLQSGLEQARQHDLLGRAGVGGAFEDDQHSLVQP